MFFRRGVRHDEWLSVKMALFTVGALLALLGMGLANDWLIGAAGLVLAAGVALRFVAQRRGSAEGNADAESAADRGPPL